MKYDSIKDRQEHCHELLKVLLPALRYVARRCGYALAVHGSLSRDIDLVAVPWRDTAISAESLIEYLRKVVAAVVGIDDPTAMTILPGYRKAWALHLTMDKGNGPYLDISVTPIVEKKRNGRLAVR